MRYNQDWIISWLDTNIERTYQHKQRFYDVDVSAV